MSQCRSPLSKITLQIIYHLSIWNFSFYKKEQIIQSYTSIFPTNCILFVTKIMLFLLRNVSTNNNSNILSYNLARMYLRSLWEWIIFLTQSCLWITFYSFKNERKPGILLTWNISQCGIRRKWEHKWLLVKGKFNIVVTANEVLGKENI